MIWFVLALSLAFAEDIDDENDLPPSAIVESKPQTGLPPEMTSEATAKRYRKECEEDGVSQSCFRYGLYLQQKSELKAKRDGAIFVRRACQMAYGPACTQRSPTSYESVVDLMESCKNPALFDSMKLKPGMTTDRKTFGLQVEDTSNPLFASAGLQIGDVLTSVNGSPFRSKSQLQESMGKGDAIVEYERAGKTLKTKFKCPK